MFKSFVILWYLSPHCSFLLRLDLAVMSTHTAFHDGRYRSTSATADYSTTVSLSVQSSEMNQWFRSFWTDTKTSYGIFKTIILKDTKTVPSLLNMQWLIRKNKLKSVQNIAGSKKDPKIYLLLACGCRRLSEQWLSGRFWEKLPVHFTVQQGWLKTVPLVREHRNRMRSVCEREKDRDTG